MTERAPKIRMFLALEPTPALHAKLVDLMTRLKKGAKFTGADPSWVPEDGLHLTLKFLGEVAPERRDAISSAVSQVTRRAQPFTQTVRSLGVFPNPRSPRVIWVGMPKPDRMLHLQEKLEDALVDVGFEPEDRAFQPHITLARLKSLKRTAALMGVVKEHRNWEFGTWPVAGVTLFQSTLRRDGATYTPLERWTLGQSSGKREVIPPGDAPADA